MNVLVQTYGPFAFGIVAVLVIWFGIMKPELSSRAFDYQKQELLVTQMREITSQQKQVIDQLNQQTQAFTTTAEILDRVTRRLDESQ